MRKYIYLLPIAILGLTACEDVIPVELNDDDVNLFAVDAKITNVDKPYVKLYKSLLVTDDKEPAGVSDAIVVISDDEIPAHTVTLVEDPNKAGYYTVPIGVDYFGVEGHEYTLTIQSGGVVLTAKDYLAPVESVDSIQVHPSKFGDNHFLAVAIFSNESAGIGNYYKWEVYVNDTLLYKTDQMAFASDELVDGNYVNDLEVFIDFHDPSKEEDRVLNLNDTILVRQNSISKTTYEFYYEMMNQNNGGFLFSVPPANAKSNFTSSDGKTVLGLFTAQSVSISNRFLIDEAIESKLKKD